MQYDNYLKHQNAGIPLKKFYVFWINAVTMLTLRLLGQCPSKQDMYSAWGRKRHSQQLQQ